MNLPRLPAVTGSTAQTQAEAKADAAILASLGASNREQAEFVSKGGWAKMPGATGEPSRNVASACAEILNRPAS